MSILYGRDGALGGTLATSRWRRGRSGSSRQLREGGADNVFPVLTVTWRIASWRDVFRLTQGVVRVRFETRRHCADLFGKCDQRLPQPRLAGLQRRHGVLRALLDVN